MKIVLIDNYDSFTYNLVHLILKIDPSIHLDIVRNDQFNLNDIEKYDKIMLSPGPGIPAESGLLLDCIKKYFNHKSILGICLGHQAIGEVFGGKLINLSEVYHGVATKINVINKTSLFNDLPNSFDVGRYHSWIVDKNNLPPDLIITSMDENNYIMSLKHTKYDVEGVQFHPESILTPLGEKIIKNWLNNTNTIKN